VSSEGIEARPADSEPGAGVGRGEVSVVEGGEGCRDDFEGEAVEKLFLFIQGLEAGRQLSGQRLWGSAPNPGVYRIGANGSGESVPSPERGSLFREPFAPAELLGLLSSRALSVAQVWPAGTIKSTDARAIARPRAGIHFCSD